MGLTVHPRATNYNSDVAQPAQHSRHSTAETTQPTRTSQETDLEYSCRPSGGIVSREAESVLQERVERVGERVWWVEGGEVGG